MASGGKEASRAARSRIAGCCFPAVLAAASETGGLPSPAETAPSCRVLVQRLVQRFPRRAATRLFAGLRTTGTLLPKLDVEGSSPFARSFVRRPEFVGLDSSH